MAIMFSIESFLIHSASFKYKSALEEHYTSHHGSKNNGDFGTDGRSTDLDDDYIDDNELDTESDSNTANAVDRLSRTSTRSGISSKSKQNSGVQRPFFDISSMFNPIDIKEDGSIKDEKIREHNLNSWQSITISCSKCDGFTGEHMKLEKHFQNMHPEEALEYICSICEKKKQFSTGYGYRNHMTKIHFPHLAHW